MTGLDLEPDESALDELSDVESPAPRAVLAGRRRHSASDSPAEFSQHLRRVLTMERRAP